MSHIKKTDYEPPRAMRLGELRPGAGAASVTCFLGGGEACTVPGSGNESCDPGLSAFGVCIESGSSASDCFVAGNSAAGYCAAPGSGF